MKLPKNLKIKKGLWNLFPFSNFTGQAIYPNIYLPESIYENLKTEKPKLQYIAVLKHEQTHIKRANKQGWIIWNLKYIFYPGFRFNEEIEAIKNSMVFFKKNNITFNTDKSAKRLSSYLYLWCVSYKKAKEKLDEIWNST